MMGGKKTLGIMMGGNDPPRPVVDGRLVKKDGLDGRYAGAFLSSFISMDVDSSIYPYLVCSSHNFEYGWRDITHTLHITSTWLAYLLSVVCCVGIGIALIIFILMEQNSRGHRVGH